MLTKSLITLAIAGGMMLFGHAASSAPREGDEAKSVAATLDAFHLAASKADGDRYFGQFAADGVFLGTDATERWTVDEFKAYAKPYFDKGQGWTYAAIEGKRFITISDDGGIAWFDELLSNDKYGTCRGSGVLRRVGENWRIAQYNLAFMIPNDSASEVVAIVKAKAR